MYVEGSVAIDLFCSLNFALSITEIEVDPHFPGRFAPISLANRVQFNVYEENFGRNRVGKCALT